jgi:hypothetical protein
MDTSVEYYGVELHKVTTRVLAWVVETYGPRGAKRWFVKDKTIFFYNRADYEMFLWRWM